MRNSSGNRRVRPYNPPGGFRSDSKGFRSRESGMGWDGSGKAVLEPWEERRPDAFAFARSLEGQHIGFAAVAYIAVECTGRKPTKQNVLERLEATGRTTAQLRERGWLS